MADSMTYPEVAGVVEGALQDVEIVDRDLAIVVEGVSKSYRLFASTRDRLREALHPFRRRYHLEHWALRDVGFSVRRGETMGILGRNGAGKSTLLQIITGVLRPTGGRVSVRGRIAALLELGTGFNPEFTGRENVMVHGAIIGVPEAEMRARLPDIQAFADIGEFFDQPVKTYSSGMFVRLAFAAAINVDPDVLIIDEALAVGDARFQEKCFRRIATLQAKGVTVLVVTHSIDAIAAHCDRAIVLHEGRLFAEGAPKDVADAYIKLLFEDESGGEGDPPIESPGGARHVDPAATAGDDFWDPAILTDRCPSRAGYNRNETRIGGDDAGIVDFRVIAEDGAYADSLRPDGAATVLVKVHFKKDFAAPVVGFALKTMTGIEIYSTNTGRSYLSRALDPVKAGDVVVYGISFDVRLPPGDYFMDIGVARENGTPPGGLADVRRSLIHLPVVGVGALRYKGLVDLRPGLVEQSRLTGGAA